MNWQTLDNLIDEFEVILESKLGTGLLAILPIPSRFTWKDIWEKAAEIQKGFKGIRYPTKDQREIAWERFNSLRDEASKQNRDENYSLRCKSESHRSAILHEIRSAQPNDLFGFDPPDIDEMKRLGQLLSEAGNMLSEYKGEMFGEHKRECFEAIQEMRKVHDAWWNLLNRVRNERRQERETRIRNNLEKNLERYQKATQALEHYRSHADDLRDKIDSAWNDDWAHEAEGWLSELEDKIADIERSIEQIEEWIREDEDKLNR